MRSSNPVFSSLTKNRGASIANPNPYQTGYPQWSTAQAFPQANDRPITVDDVITKTGITLAVIIGAAVINAGISTFSPMLSSVLTIVGAIGGLVCVLISTFGKKYGSAAVTLTYAAFEGLFVGGISLIFSGLMIGSKYASGGADAGVMIGQAVIATVGVFLGMLYVYKTGAVKVTPKFNRIMLGSLIGVVVLAFGNILLYTFTGHNPLTNGGPIAIIFSLVCIGLAAFSFLTDFDVADQLVRAGAPSKMAWGVALGLAVTLVWLYTEILRLLSYFRN